MSEGQTECGCGDSFCGDCAGGGCGDKCAGGGCDSGCDGLPLESASGRGRAGGRACAGPCPKDLVIEQLRKNLDVAVARMMAAEAELGNLREVANEIDAFFDRVDALAEARKTRG